MQHAKKKPTNEIKLKNAYCFIYFISKFIIMQNI